MSRFIDLSHDVTPGMRTYPGLPEPRLGSVFTHAESRGRYAPGVEFTIGTVELCANTGTYLDTPYHRYADGHDLTGLPLDRCADLPVLVIDAVGAVTAGDIPADLAEVAGKAVLIRTGWSARWGSESYFESTHPFLDASGAAALVAAGAALVGIDALNIDTTVGNDRPAHTLLLAAGIPIVEHLTNLDAVPSFGARFTAVPPKIAGLGTFTVRAFVAISAN